MYYSNANSVDTDTLPADINADAAANGSDPLIPDHASYLIAANAHQQAGNNSSIFDPTTWGDRIENGMKFGVSMLTRAVSSTYNAGITVGKLVGLTDDSDKASTQDWLSSMDDDLGKYYQQNQSSIDTWGDALGMLIPGTAGTRVFNLAQKGIELATEGRAGLSLAYNFGTLPNKAAKFAELAKAEITNTNNPFSLISANVVKSFAAGTGQSYLEMAAFQVAAETTMTDSPLFKDHDLGDIAYNALTAGGFIGGGILGAAGIASTVSKLRKAGDAVDAGVKGFSTVQTEVAEGTRASEAMSIALDNRAVLTDKLSGLDSTDILAAQKSRAADNTIRQEENNARTQARVLSNDDFLGNHFANVALTSNSESFANNAAGITSISLAGIKDEADAGAAITKAESVAAKSANQVEAATNKLQSAAVGTTEYSSAESALAKYTAAHVDNLDALAAKRAEPTATDYLKLTGTDAGVIYSQPPTLHIADSVKSAPEAQKVVDSFKHKQSQTGYSVPVDLTAKGEDSVEARYIKAQYGDFDPAESIGVSDLPYLDRAYMEMRAGNISTVKLSDGSELGKTDLYHHIVTEKSKAADLIESGDKEFPTGSTPINQATLAKVLNVSNDFVVGTRTINSEADLARMQQDSIDFTKKQIDAGLWNANKGIITTWDKPSIARCNRDTSKAQAITGHEIDGITALKEEQAIYRTIADNVFNNFNPEWAAKYLDRIPAAVLLSANRSSTGRGLLTSMNGDYGSLASFVQQMGTTTAAWKTEVLKGLSTTFESSGHQLLTDTDAGTEFWKIAHQMRKTSENYRLVQDYAGKEASEGASGTPHLVNTKQLDWEAAGSDPEKLPTFIDKSAPVAIPITTDGARQWATDWDNYHRTEQAHTANLRASQGLSYNEANGTNFYIPPVDAKRFPYYALVVDDSITSTGHVSMIHANTASDLEALVNKVPTDQGLRVIHKDQGEEFFKAQGSYDYKLSINDNYIDSALQRSGAAAPFQPVTVPKVLWGELMDYRARQATGLVNEMISHKFSPEFAELRRQGQLYDLANTSVKGYVDKWRQARTSNPYNDYIATALYNEPSGGAPIWDAVNRLAETSVATLSSKLADTWKDVISPEDLGKVNTHLESIGVKAYTDAATYMLANHTAPKPALSAFVSSMNSILSTLMLRTDPMNAVNNAMGHSVLYGAEMRKLNRYLDKLVVPGTKSSILSPVKMAASAYSDWFDKVIGGADGGVLEAECNRLNLLPSITQEIKQMVASGTLDGTEGSADLYKRTDTAFAAMKSALAKTATIGESISGNRWAEQMNRFVSGVTAMRACDRAIEAGTLDPALRDSIINTFVNRVEGINLAKQRPLLFKGPIGQAVGLFQTYQFNMLQQLFRHVGEGDMKTTGMLLGLQGSIYGMNGLPAFNVMNQYLVGNAAGNTSHMDTITATYGAAGKELGDWLLYGAASNMLLHPDAKMNLYSRGDINPRQLTVIPTTMADVPIIGATTKFFGSMFDAMQQMDKGGNIWNTFLNGVAHSGISRPLTGFAQVLEGVTSPNQKVTSTDNANNIVMENDLYSIMTAGRLLGAKPLDEAIATDAFHRVQTYNAASTKQIENLGSSIKATVEGGGVPSQDQIDGFVNEYAKAGGRQQNFSKFYTRQVLNANKSKVNQMIDNSNRSGSQYMQQAMGGYSLSDYVNSSTGAAGGIGGGDTSTGGKSDITGGQ